MMEARPGLSAGRGRPPYSITPARRDRASRLSPQHLSRLSQHSGIVRAARALRALLPSPAGAAPAPKPARPTRGTSCATPGGGVPGHDGADGAAVPGRVQRLQAGRDGEPPAQQGGRQRDGEGGGGVVARDGRGGLQGCERRWGLVVWMIGVEWLIARRKLIERRCWRGLGRGLGRAQGGGVVASSGGRGAGDKEWVPAVRAEESRHSIGSGSSRACAYSRVLRELLRTVLARGGRACQLQALGSCGFKFDGHKHGTAARSAPCRCSSPWRRPRGAHTAHTPCNPSRAVKHPEGARPRGPAGDGRPRGQPGRPRVPHLHAHVPRRIRAGGAGGSVGGQ